MDKKLLGLSSLLLIAFLGFTGYVLWNGTLNVQTRANIENKAVSEQNSLVFAWPLSVPADNTTSSEVTVFVRNADGKGLEGQAVRITSSLGTVSPQTVVSDSDGKAVFLLTSGEAGISTIEAVVNSKKMARTITVEFK